MRILNLDKVDDFRMLSDEVSGHLRGKRLVPIIGSGFTRGSASGRGTVPSGRDMKSHMLLELKEHFLGSEDRIRNMKFSKVASLYEKHVDNRKKLRYLEDNFTYVNIGDNKNRFLNIEWPYMYTLNIDDGIENNTKAYEVILPNADINEEYIEGKRCVFKLHGDVHDVLKYKSSNKYIFSESQYLSSLKTNLALLNLLKNDLISNNLIYIGCSLEDETDILSSILEVADFGTEIRKTNYFVIDKHPDDLEISQLEDFGVTCIVIVGDYDDFYDLMVKLHQDSNKIKEDGIDDYLNFDIKYIREKDFEKNTMYLFDSKAPLNNLEKKVIYLPSFFINREVTQKFSAEFNNFYLLAVYGHRISGKTYFLYSLINTLKDRDVYFIPSNINLDFSTLKTLIHKKRVVLLFDTNTLDDRQVRFIIDHIYKLRENDSRVVVTVNSSDKEVINILSSVDKRELLIDEIKNKFNTSEIRKVNEGFSLLGVPNFDVNKSLLDNIITVEDVLPQKQFALQKRAISQPSKELLVVLIIMAVKETLPSMDLVRFDLAKEIGHIYQELEPLIQYEYTALFEKSEHSGSKLVPNAKYWILRMLGDFAKNSKNHDQVAEAYLYIASRLKRNLSKDQRFSKEISKYIKFDVINDIFPRSEHGSVALINKVYDRLQPVLSTEPQYFHQKAKSKLWYYRNSETELKEALRFAKTAEHNLNLQKYSDDYKNTSLNHVKFTISTILGRMLVLDGFQNGALCKEAIEAYYIALKEKDNEQYLAYSLNKHFKNRDAADLKKIIDAIALNQKLADSSMREEYNFLLNLVRRLSQRPTHRKSNQRRR